MTSSRPRAVLTPDLYFRVRARLAELGYGEDYRWSESLRDPASPEDLLCEYTWVVLCSGMKATVARGIMDRVWPRVVAGLPISPVFGHAGKAAAIESTWRDRALHFQRFGEVRRTSAPVADTLDWCASLPWIGSTTKFHLAKNLGVDCAKPDRWLARLAQAEGETVDELCSRLAAATGDRVATVDVVLWRACAVGVLRVEDGAIRLRDAPAPAASGAAGAGPEVARGGRP